MLISFHGNRRARVGLALVATLAVTAAACGSGSTSEPTAASAASSGSVVPLDGEPGSDPVTLRLGYFPNVTHAPAIVGIDDGLFAAALGSSVTLKTTTFNSGTEVVEAMFSGALDASFVGPNPAINGYAKSKGKELRIVAGTTAGGASLVVRDGIDSPADLQGTTLATPALGNTQDVALRAWLEEQGFDTDTAGGGDVHITPQDNADTLAAFTTGAIDGAWVPEPWATRLVDEGGGHTLVDERELWPEGRFVTTHLIVTTKFLDEHPVVVEHLIEGLADTIEQINADPAAAQATTNAGIGKLTSKPLADDTISGAWQHLEFTLDPIASSLQVSAEHAEAAGLLDPVDLASPGIYDLTLLNEVLAARSEAAVSGL